MFIKNVIDNKIKYNSNFFYLISLLSFNGGLAQSNSGTNLCHALAHAEKITKIDHNECVFFSFSLHFIYAKKQKIREIFLILKK